MTSERKTSHSPSRASWRWTNCWRCASADAGNSRTFTERPCALYFALKRLDQSLVSPVVSLPVQYVIWPFAFCMAARSIAFAFFTACGALPPPLDEVPSSPPPPQAAASRAVAIAATAASCMRRTTSRLPVRLSAGLPPAGGRHASGDGRDELREQSVEHGLRVVADARVDGRRLDDRARRRDEPPKALGGLERRHRTARRVAGGDAHERVEVGADGR